MREGEESLGERDRGIVAGTRTGHAKSTQVSFFLSWGRKVLGTFDFSRFSIPFPSPFSLAKNNSLAYEIMIEAGGGRPAVQF